MRIYVKDGILGREYKLNLIVMMRTLSLVVNTELEGRTEKVRGTAG